MKIIAVDKEISTKHFIFVKIRLILKFSIFLPKIIEHLQTQTQGKLLKYASLHGQGRNTFMYLMEQTKSSGVH